MESYLKSADEALDRAINLSAKPYRKFVFDIRNSPTLAAFDKRAFGDGGELHRRLGDGVAIFFDQDFIFRSAGNGFSVTTPGLYRITLKAEAFQSEKPVTL